MLLLRRNSKILLGACLQRCRELGIPETDTIAIVQIKDKCLSFFQKRTLLKTYPVSTAKNGVGQEEGSGKTPLGLHRIAEKIGNDANLHSVFKSRVITDDVASIGAGDRYITTRILRLRGLEEGLNAGLRQYAEKAPICVDSWDRYIYIHGTNYADDVGRIDGTKGCICMKPESIVDFFEKIPTGSLVYIGV